ncbi:hypothetical protein [Frateuria sp. STR12]|uniref:hypothetical protein n=1 Tax=Frateuria hangzhouensis TaxID=2995589 RepID=UPI002260D12E|nr:hypothetical protein [Frateuria sp. STR12]MCX7514334.1 hypothetical protein [Frateuria sp. STR12]
MQRILAVAMAALFTGSCAGPSASFASGLCRAGETTYFSCPTARHKTIALCGGLPGALQYRYGTASKVELAYPQDAAEGPQKLGYAHYARYQAERTEVGFSRADVDYAVFDYTEQGRRSAGVRVAGADGAEHEVICAGAIDGRLEPLGKDLRCDADSALNGGQCP